jgi:hypothetical protein
VKPVCDKWKAKIVAYVLRANPGHINRRRGVQYAIHVRGDGISRKQARRIALNVWQANMMRLTNAKSVFLEHIKKKRVHRSVKSV